MQHLNLWRKENVLVRSVGSASAMQQILKLQLCALAKSTLGGLRRAATYEAYVEADEVIMEIMIKFVKYSTLN